MGTQRDVISHHPSNGTTGTSRRDDSDMTQEPGKPLWVHGRLLAICQDAWAQSLHLPRFSRSPIVSKFSRRSWSRANTFFGFPTMCHSSTYQDSIKSPLGMHLSSSPSMNPSGPHASPWCTPRWLRKNVSLDRTMDWIDCGKCANSCTPWVPCLYTDSLLMELKAIFSSTWRMT
jgi:hypothetical protein